MHASPFPSPATKMAKSAPAPCISSSVTDLSSGWHADGPLVCASTPLVFRSIPPSLLLSSSCNECALLAAERIPKRHRGQVSPFLLQGLHFCSYVCLRLKVCVCVARVLLRVLCGGTCACAMVR